MPSPFSFTQNCSVNGLDYDPMMQCTPYNCFNHLFPASSKRKYKSLALANHFRLLLLKAGDVESNLGAGQKDNCGICNNTAATDSYWIECMLCRQWYHIDCYGNVPEKCDTRDVTFVTFFSSCPSFQVQEKAGVLFPSDAGWAMLSSQIPSYRFNPNEETRGVEVIMNSAALSISSGQSSLEISAVKPGLTEVEGPNKTPNGYICANIPSHCLAHAKAKNDSSALNLGLCNTPKTVGEVVPIKTAVDDKVTYSVLKPENKVEPDAQMPSCSSLSQDNDNSSLLSDGHLNEELTRLNLTDEGISFQNQKKPQCRDSLTSTVPQSKELLENDIRIVPYEDERQMKAIMELLSKDLSEPYSIYTYRYFIHNWPELCFLAEHSEEIVGAIVCKLDVHKRNTRRGYIAMLAVHEKFRRKKIGSELVIAAIRKMISENCDEVVLETEVTNTQALKLYEKLGFVRDKRLFRYYLNGVDAFRLKLWLTYPSPLFMPFM